MSVFSVDRLCAGYGRERIVENISFQLDNGCLMGLLGANGSGKTTLLKALCGILPHSGQCTWNGTVLERLSARQLAGLVGYIPQRSGISIDISALDVVLMGWNPHLGLLEHPSKAMADAAVQALAQVGLSGKEQINYLHLSEGQKQLCILARTLVADSHLLLLDEPESALDFRFRHEMLSLLRNRITGKQRAAIVALHDPTLALNFCDKLLLLSHGEISGVLEPKTDSHDKMEQLLGMIYGPVSLHTCRSRKGEAQLVMLREEER